MLQILCFDAVPFISMHLKISISAFIFMACCDIEVSDSEELWVSYDYDVQAADDLSADSDNNVPSDQLLGDSRRQDRDRKLHHIGR
jgi:hypothetical protein